MIPRNEALSIPRDLYFNRKICIERKASLEEISGNLTNGRDRFEKELSLAPETKVLLIENADYGDIAAGNYNTQYNKKSFVGSLHSFWFKYNVPVFFMKENKYSGLFIRMYFEYYFKNYLNSYIKGKRKDCEYVGIKFNHIHITDYENLDESDLCQIIKGLDNSKEVDGIIIQLPIPDKYNIKILQQFISPEKDVDGFRKDSLYNPCTPQGIIDWLEVNDIDLRGKLVTVLGRSDIVGKPLVNMLIDKGATVISCNSKTQKYHIENFMKMSDIVISAIGKPKKFDSFYFGIDTIIIDVAITPRLNKNK